MTLPQNLKLINMYTLQIFTYGIQNSGPLWGKCTLL
jgi:hypothetical protein